MTTTEYDPGPVPEETRPLAGDGDELTDDELELSRIEEDGALWRAMRSLGYVARRRKARLARALAEHQRIDAWLDRDDKSDARREAYHRLIIESFARERRAESAGRVKSIDTPYGLVRTREVKGRVVIADRDAFFEWVHAEDRQDMVRVKEEPDSYALAAHVKATGELPPGCALGEDSLSVIVEPTVEDPS